MSSPFDRGPGKLPRDPEGKVLFLTRRQWSRIYPLVFNWPWKVIEELWLEFGSVLHKDYPWTWFLGEILWFLVGLNFSLFTMSNIWIVILVTEAAGFAAEYLKRHMHPWSYAVTLNVRSAAAGSMVGIGLRLLAILGTFLPGNSGIKRIMTAGSTRNGGDMQPPRRKRFTSFENIVMYALIICAALMLFNMKSPLLFTTARWTGVFLATAGVANSIYGEKYTVIRRILQFAGFLILGSGLLFLPKVVDVVLRLF